MTRVVVIDDDYDIVDILCQYLEIKGFEVVGHGYNGQEAIDLYERLRPDILFLDVMMPHFDGFYALERIRVFDPIALVIMITGDIRPETHVKLRNFSVSAIIPKPFDFNKMSSMVESLIAKKQKSVKHISKFGDGT
jgi:DNA-binding response OmpR family regulator